MSICLIEKEVFKLERQKNFGEYDKDGFPSDPKVEEGTFKGMAVPLTGNEILQVPEGDRTRKNLNIFTAFELEHADIVIRNDERFEVQATEDWTMQGICIQFYKTRVVKVDVAR